MESLGRLPAGIGDLLPEERERIESVGAGLGRLFAAWGYRRVEPPAFEYYATFSTGSPGFSEERAYRFLDRDGQLLALRPDMTTGIARMVARESVVFKAAATESPLPLRLRYEGVVFRNELQGSGRSHTLCQAGVELIGAPGLEADAEVIGLACEAVRKAGLADARLVLGHAGLAWGAAVAGSPPQGRSDVAGAFRKAVAAKDMVSLEGILEPGLAELFLGGPYALGEAVAVLARLRERSGPGQLADGAAELEALLALLPGYGVDDAWLDLALLRDLDYYTGAVFELVCPGKPEAIAGGGRYDSLLARFGSDLPATGFAVNLSLASSSAPRASGRPERVAVAWSTSQDRITALSLARSLRSGGAVAETLPGAGDVRRLLGRAAARGCSRLILVAGGGCREVRVGASSGASSGGRPPLMATGWGGIH